MRPACESLGRFQASNPIDFERSVGKGDRRTRRGKIWRQTHGKPRSRSQEQTRARQRHGPKPSQLKQKNKES
ncbi:MAG TPA: 30S ribosomal protein THX [Acidobacteriota bacterium]